MIDRPDPFDDLEFETAEPADAEEVIAQVAPAPAPAEAPAPAPAAEAKEEAPAPAAKAEPEEKPAKVAKGASPVIGYATLALSGLAFAGTIAAVVTTLSVRPHEPKVSPEHAAIGRIEALLTLQQGKLEHIAHEAAQPAPAPATAPQVDPGQLAALGAAVKANQETLDRLPGLIAAHANQATRVVMAPAPKPVVITKQAPAAPAQSPQVAEVLKAQAAIQKQLDALTAKMAKTTAACVQQNDGVIRYPG